jgi:hypothetical protein
MRQLPFVMLAAVVLIPALSFPQAPADQPPAAPTVAPHTMPPQPKRMPIPKWDPASVETLSGKVVGVWRHKQYGVVVGIDTEKDDIVLLSVGPAYFIDPKITFAAGDLLEATGSRVHYHDHVEMLVSTLKRGDLTVHVRSDKGKKRW